MWVCASKLRDSTQGLDSRRCCFPRLPQGLGCCSVAFWSCYTRPRQLGGVRAFKVVVVDASALFELWRQRRNLLTRVQPEEAESGAAAAGAFAL